MVCCSAYGCSNRSEKKKPGLTFHRFPKNEARRAAWVKAVKRKDWTPSSVSSLCSNHFLPDDFDRTSLSCVRLREYAVPSVFSDSPSYTSPKVIKKMDLTKRKPEEVERPAFAPPQEKAEEIICEPILVPQPMEDYEEVSGGDELAQLRKEVEELKRELKRVNDLYLGARRKIKTLQQAKRRHDKGKTDSRDSELIVSEEPSSSEELGKGPKHGRIKDIDVKTGSPLITHSGDGEDSLTTDSKTAEGHWDEAAADSPGVTAGSVRMGFEGTRNGYADSECRTCYMSCQSTKHIFTEEESGKLLYEIINDVYKLEIYPDDGLSEYICNICHQSVLEFERVKKTSHEGQVALISIWKKLSKEGKSMHHLCRLCVNDSNFSKNIFNCKHHGVLLYEIINGLCCLNLSEDDGLPSYLCGSCFAKMVEFSELKAFAQRGKASVPSKGFGMSQILLKRLSQPAVNGGVSMPDTGVHTDDYQEPGSNQEEEMQEEEDWSVDFSLARGAGGARGGMGQQRTHNCRYCGKGFESEYELIEHIRVHEGEQPPFPCFLCGKTFSRRTNLKTHLRRHTGERPYPCDHCGKPFASRSALNLHSLTHTGHRPHGCQVCGRRFVSMSNLRKHEKLVHLRERPFKCDACGEDFASSWSFKSHYRKHKLQKKEEAPQKSVCDIQCGIKCEISTEQPSCDVGLDLTCPARNIPAPLESLKEEQVSE